MRIIVIGGGPAGLYFSLLMKKAHPHYEITVFERNPADATYGWGIVFSDRTLEAFREADYKTYQEITRNFVVWETIETRLRGERLRCQGHVFAGIARRTLLRILQKRCEELGVNLVFNHEISVPPSFSEVDLLVGADGVNSLIRRCFASAFQPRLTTHRNRYIWYGTTCPFENFTFIFQENSHGVFQAHIYPFEGALSTFIIECDEATWRRAGLGEMSESESIAYCQALFAEHLRGHPLLSNRSRWLSFTTVRCRRWSHERCVLIGDAAHTAHFSIGSGTKLAMEDAIALANALDLCGHDISTALAFYELERRPAVESLQEAAQRSLTYFENVHRHMHFDPIPFVFRLLTRSGRVDYLDLARRDRRFVHRVNRWFAIQTQEDNALPVAVPPPVLVPLRVRGVTIENRIALNAPPVEDAHDGEPPPSQVASWRHLARYRPGLILTDLAAVSPDGRISSRTLGLYRPEHVRAWASCLRALRSLSPTRVALRLNHAGRRAATVSRWRGRDIPDVSDHWDLLSASPIPYTPYSPAPREMTRSDMERVRDAFVEAARLALEAGFDILEIHMAHGYLLGSFLSPLANLRTDAYGGTLENRMRFPLEVVEAVRRVWPEERPLFVALSVTDWAPGGVDVEEAVRIARALKACGCDLIEVLAGQTVLEDSPSYDPYTLIHLSDIIRNEAQVLTLVGSGMRMPDEANGVLAAERADLCLLIPVWEECHDERPGAI